MMETNKLELETWNLKLVSLEVQVKVTSFFYKF